MTLFLTTDLPIFPVIFDPMRIFGGTIIRYVSRNPPLSPLMYRSNARPDTDFSTMMANIHCLDVHYYEAGQYILIYPQVEENTPENIFSLRESMRSMFDIPNYIMSGEDLSPLLAFYVVQEFCFYQLMPNWCRYNKIVPSPIITDMMSQPRIRANLLSAAYHNGVSDNHKHGFWHLNSLRYDEAKITAISISYCDKIRDLPHTLSFYGTSPMEYEKSTLSAALEACGNNLPRETYETFFAFLHGDRNHLQEVEDRYAARIRKQMPLSGNLVRKVTRKLIF